MQTPGSRATRNVYGKLIVACLNQIQTLFKKPDQLASEVLSTEKYDQDQLCYRLVSKCSVNNEYAFHTWASLHVNPYLAEPQFIHF